MARTILLTGATGLIGSGVLQRLARAQPDTRYYVLTRSLGRWRALEPALGLAAGRAYALRGDLTAPGLALSPYDRGKVLTDVDTIIHCGADVVFSRPLAQSRAVNTEGTRGLLELAADADRLERFVYVSTAFVVGRRTGRIDPNTTGPDCGWVNAYEQSKAEAELLVRASGVPWTILRPSTVVCDDVHGRISQYNAVHRALALSYNGLTPMLPGTADSPVDVVTTKYVARAIAELSLRDDMIGRTLHLCAGTGALPLGELFERTYAVWSRNHEWRRRGVSRPAFADPATYGLFEQTVELTADSRLRRIARALSHFAPQLGCAKHFDTHDTDSALGRSAPPARAFWDAMVHQLLVTNWGTAVRRAA